ncbi:hypothetical protein [Halomonas sp. PR-M31]|uniref:hypothetical protein n=1 Tax=Halomonas sp. PR-M31 TaxID=1471202 RepID=UPI000651C312|nr:hypothetical protein [Halomonas sp. PR-M31]
MPFNEAKEHALGRLHAIFSDPYSAFDNSVTERQLHLNVAIEALLGQAMADNRMTIDVIHGWENGECEPAELQHSSHSFASLDDLRQIARHYRNAIEAQEPLPRDTTSLIAEQLADAIAAAQADGQALDEETRTIPARWPAFVKGLTLYTYFKMYHRLTYGEDEPYRSIRCEASDGLREIHEFHVEEGEFAVVLPVEDETLETVLTLHESQLEPVLQIFEKFQIGG